MHVLRAAFVLQGCAGAPTFGCERTVAGAVAGAGGALGGAMAGAGAVAGAGGGAMAAGGEPSWQMPQNWRFFRYRNYRGISKSRFNLIIKKT